VQELTLGAGLSLASTTLSASGGVVRVKNTSGSTATANDVGYIDNNGEYKTTTTEAFGGAWCVVLVGAANNSDIWVARRGRATVKLNGNCSVGDKLVTSTTAGQAKPYSYDHYNLLAVALTANSSGAGGTCEALLYTSTQFAPLSSGAYVFEIGTTAGLSTTRFETTINTGSGTLSTTNVPYGTTTAGNENNLLFTSGQLTYLKIYNSTRGTYRNSTTSNITTNNITTVATTDSWANGDTITSNSQVVTVTGAWFQTHELQDTATIPPLSRTMVINVLGTDVSSPAPSLQFNDYVIVFHPHETFGGGKQQWIYVPSSSKYNAGVANIPLVNRRYDMRVVGGNIRSYAYIVGAYVAVP
jgi:hypothetical protein